jgi:hypothetical protein
VTHNYTFFNLKSSKLLSNYSLTVLLVSNDSVLPWRRPTDIRMMLSEYRIAAKADTTIKIGKAVPLIQGLDMRLNWDSSSALSFCFIL